MSLSSSCTDSLWKCARHNALREGQQLAMGVNARLKPDLAQGAIIGGSDLLTTQEGRRPVLTECRLWPILSGRNALASPAGISQRPSTGSLGGSYKASGRSSWFPLGAEGKGHYERN